MEAVRRLMHKSRQEMIGGVVQGGRREVMEHVNGLELFCRQN